MTSSTFRWLPNQGYGQTNVQLTDRKGISDWKQNLNFGSLGLLHFALPPKPLKTPIPGILSQPSFKDNGIFEVTVSCKWFGLTPTRGWSSVFSPGCTNTVDAWQGGKCAKWTRPAEPPHSTATGEEEGAEAGKQTWQGQENHPRKWNLCSIFNAHVYSDYSLPSPHPK